MNVKELKLAFFGTPEFAAYQLKYLVENNYNIAAVITAVDKPAGRGKTLKYSAVKEVAINNGLNLLQPNNLKSLEFIAVYDSLHIDCAIVVAFRMLPRALWNKARLGTFNLHASLLPDYRGAAPIQWAIRNGEEQTGLTTFIIDDQIDTGGILLQETCAIDPNENAETLHDKLMHMGPSLIAQTLEGLHTHTLRIKAQNVATQFKTAPKLTKENTQIDLDLSAKEFCQLIRSLNPHPGAQALLKEGAKETVIKILEVSYAPLKTIEKHHLIIEESRIYLGLKDSSVELLRWQFPSKRGVNVKDFLNGYRFKTPVFVFSTL
ncbi:MAG: methionyl-tRNA formyltransferase [Bacteroidetes bacterium]|nr:methionyl-tRNA formyltransferase [Bacteroidota bacterium]